MLHRVCVTFVLGAYKNGGNSKHATALYGLDFTVSIFGHVCLGTAVVCQPLGWHCLPTPSVKERLITGGPLHMEQKAYLHSMDVRKSGAYLDGDDEIDFIGPFIVYV